MKAKLIILASASPRRKEILEKAGLKFQVDAGSYEEDMGLDMGPHKLARFLSREKAKALAEKYSNALIIAADTFIIFKGQVLGKPHTAGHILWLQVSPLLIQAAIKKYPGQWKQKSL